MTRTSAPPGSVYGAPVSDPAWIELCTKHAGSETGAPTNPEDWEEPQPLEKTLFLKEMLVNYLASVR
jgi:hypothetical protein